MKEKLLKILARVIIFLLDQYIKTDDNFKTSPEYIKPRVEQIDLSEFFESLHDTVVNYRVPIAKAGEHGD